MSAPALPISDQTELLLIAANVFMTLPGVGA